MYRNKFTEICEHYEGFSHLYTYGSKMEERVAAAVVYNFHKNYQTTK